MDLLIFFAIAPAYLVGRYFLDNKVGPREPKKEVERSIAFGVLALVLAIAISTLFDVLFFAGESRLTNSFQFSNSEIFPYVLVHATVEEFTKFIPLALFIYHKRFFNENSDGIIYFAIVGLTFGSIETFLYSLTGGALFTTISRFVIGLFFHAALTSLVGFFLAASKVYHRTIWPTILALLGASLLHALYNFALVANGFGEYFWLLSVLISLLVNCFMFWEFYVAAEHDKLLILNKNQQSSV